MFVILTNVRNARGARIGRPQHARRNVFEEAQRNTKTIVTVALEQFEKSEQAYAMQRKTGAIPADSNR